MNLAPALALSLVAATADAQPASASAPASAASAPSRAASAPAIPSSRPIGILPGEDYPVDLMKAGVQGTVTVLVTLGPDGKPADATIQKTSRSQQLDAAALEYVHRVVKVGNAEHPAPPQVLVPIDFVKDSVRTLGTKTCADFVVDATYFRATFPDKTLRDMNVINLSAGAIVLMQQMAVPRMLAVSRHTKVPEVEATLAACAAHPDDRFFATFQHVVDDAIAKDR